MQLDTSALVEALSNGHDSGGARERWWHDGDARSAGAYVPHHTNLPEGCEETNGARGQTDSASHEGFPCSQELLWQPVSSSCGTLFLSQTFAWALARFSERS